MITNPFTTLGFSPAFIRRYSDEDIRTLVLSAYRALSRLHHPDVGGSSVRFRQVTQAYELLEDRDQFAYWKENFLRYKKDRVEELLAELATKLHEVNGQLATYLSAFTAPEGESLNVFNLPTCVMLVSDVAGLAVRNANLVSVYGGLERVPKSSWYEHSSKGTQVFDLEVNHAGNLRKFLVDKDFGPSSQHSVTRPGWSYTGDEALGGRSRSYCWTRTGQEAPLLGYKLVGCLRDYWSDKARDFSIPKLLANQDIVAANRKVVDGFNLKDFEGFFPYLRPILEKQAYLIAARVSQGEIYFSILGRLLKYYVADKETE